MLGIENYKALAQPPKEALKTITGGRLNGKTDINPQWRYEAMTKQYGLCGIGWKYTIDRVWTEPAPDEQVFAWVQISLYIKVGESWSEAIPGLGGNFLVEKERSSLHANDEGFKMAETDALGTAMKKIGLLADVYADDGMALNIKTMGKARAQKMMQINFTMMFLGAMRKSNKNARKRKSKTS
jgi:hypothetical protein